MDVREKLVELAQEYFDSVPWYADIADLNAEKFADNLIAHSVTVQEWIPVTERLPKNGDVVLVHGTRGGIYTAEFRLYSDFGGEYPHWHKLNSKSHYCKATHWMPLPTPPKGE